MVSIQKVGLADADKLLAFSKKTFYEFFAHQNTPQNMELYSAAAFTPTKIVSEISNPNSAFYFAVYEDDIAGYIKLNFGDAQTEFRDDNCLEVERIYVSGEHHGKHIGRQLLNFAIQTAADKHMDYIWLGVWENNYKAIGFYQHHGFEPVGTHEFWLGNDRQVDLLMKKAL